MINVLYDLQLSATDLTDDARARFWLRTDSNVDVAGTLITGLLARVPDARVYVVAPKREQIVGAPRLTSDYVRALGLSAGDPVQIIEHQACPVPLLSRYSFDPIAFETAVSTVQGPVDVLLSNDPCRVLGQKTVLARHNLCYHRPPPLIGTRFHWLTGRAHRKVDPEVDFVVRQVEGAMHSDWVTFNSRSAVAQFLFNAEEYFNSDVVASLAKKCDGFEAVDLDRIDRAMPAYDPFARLLGPPVIIWAHRFSYYTGWNVVFPVFDAIWNAAEYSFSVFVTDPTARIVDRDAFRKDHPWAVFLTRSGETLPPQEYFAACWRANIVVGCHTYPTIWGGYAVTEPMAAGCAPLLPRRDAYMEMFYPHETRAWFDDSEGWNDLRQRLVDLITMPDLRRDLGLAARQFCQVNLRRSAFVDRFARFVERARRPE